MHSFGLFKYYFVLFIYTNVFYLTIRIRIAIIITLLIIIAFMHETNHDMNHFNHDKIYYVK